MDDRSVRSGPRLEASKLRYSLLVPFALGCASASTEPLAGGEGHHGAAAARTWCSSIEAAVGRSADGQGFECLQLPNFLVTGFYGTRDNPERSDFVNGCFAGEPSAAERLKMSVRRAPDLQFAYRTEKRVEADGSIDLGFLGAWAPRVSASGSRARAVTVTVELADAEIRVLSSVAEILGQEYRRESERERGGDRAALEACLTSLCDGASEAETLVYTAKVLAAVPVISVHLDSSEGSSSSLALAAGVAEFEMRRSERDQEAFELRAKEKLNVAAMLETARPALERAGTCNVVRQDRARRSLITALRNLGLRTVAGREIDSVPAETAALREQLRRTPEAWTADEQRDLSTCLEAIDVASREMSAKSPSRPLCAARDLLGTVLGTPGGDNHLHDLITEIAQPLLKRMTEVANDHALPCADPAFYRDEDHDGYGDAKSVVRAPKAPPGYVPNSLDCYDHNPEAHPGQSKYFTSPRGDASFDYDCDGRSLAQSSAIAGGCKEITRFGIPIRCWAEPGWQTQPPACGNEGRWFSVCESGMLSCDEGPVETRRQPCR